MQVDSLPLSHQEFSTSTLWVFWDSESFVVGSVLCTAGFLAASLASSLPVLLPNCYSQKWLQTLPRVFWGRNLAQIEKHFSEVFSSVQFSRSVVSDSLQPHESQHARPPCASPTPRVYPNSCPWSRWFHPAISSSVVPSPPAPNPSQHQGLFQWVNSSYKVAKVLEFQLQHQSLQWTPRTDLLQDGLVGSPCSPRDSQESSVITQFKGINSSVLRFFHSPTLTSIHDHWKSHSLDQTDLCWQSNVSAFEYSV